MYEGPHAPSGFQPRPTLSAATPHSLFASKSVDLYCTALFMPFKDWAFAQAFALNTIPSGDNSLS